MPRPLFGNAGHIGFAVNRVEVARRLLQREGFHFPDNGEVRKNGRLKVVYLAEQVGGLALHLFQRDP